MALQIAWLAFSKLYKCLQHCPKVCLSALDLQTSAATCCSGPLTPFPGSLGTPGAPKQPTCPYPQSWLARMLDDPGASAASYALTAPAVPTPATCSSRIRDIGTECWGRRDMPD